MSSEVDLGQYPFKLVKVEYDMNPSKKGWDKMKISIPVSVRQRYIDDPIHAGEWKSFLADFDEKQSGFKKERQNLRYSPFTTYNEP